MKITATDCVITVGGIPLVSKRVDQKKPRKMSIRAINVLKATRGYYGWQFAAEIAEKCKLPLRSVRTTLGALRDYGLVTAKTRKRLRRYQITDLGVQVLEAVWLERKAGQPVTLSGTVTT